MTHIFFKSELTKAARRKVILQVAQDVIVLTALSLSIPLYTSLLFFAVAVAVAVSVASLPPVPPHLYIDQSFAL